MIVHLQGYNFRKIIKSILDTAELKKETAITIVAESQVKKELVDFLKENKNVGLIKMGTEEYFIIKHMRIEVKQIDFYV